MATARTAPAKVHPAIQRQAGPDWSCAAILLYGPPGVGKTTTALFAPAPLVLDVEGGVKRWAGDSAAVRSVAELESLIDYLAHQPHPYESVILDGLDALYALAHEASSGGREAKDRRLGHVEPGEKLAAALRRLMTLPMLKLITAHSREELDRAGGPPSIVLALPRAFRERVEGMVDVGAYCWRDRGARQMVADMAQPGRVPVWGKDRTGVFGAKFYPLAWKTLAGALRLDGPAPVVVEATINGRPAAEHDEVFDD